MATGGGGSGGGGKGAGQDVGGIFVSLGLDAAPFRNDLERAKAATELMNEQLEKLKQQAASGAIPLSECAAKTRELQQAMRAVDSAMQAAGVQTAKQAAAAKASADKQVQAADMAARAESARWRKMADDVQKAEVKAQQSAEKRAQADEAAADRAARAESARWRKMDLDLTRADVKAQRAAGTPADMSGVGAAGAFASYASQTEAATRATIALTAAQANARNAATASFAAYAGVGQKVADVSKSVAGIADKKTTDLILKVQGQAEADGLRAKISDLRQQMVALGPSVSANDPRMLALGNQMRSATERADLLDKQFGRARNGMAGFGQAGLQTGRVLQDLAQGGIPGILNNIEGLVQSLGGGPGLAGVMTAVGVAAFIARPYLEKLFEDKAAQPLKTAIDTLQAKIDAIDKKPIKFITDRAELEAAQKDLDRLKAGAEAYRQAMTGRTKHEEASERAVADAFKEAGPEVHNALRKKIADDQLAKDPGIKENVAKLAKEREHLAYLEGGGLTMDPSKGLPQTQEKIRKLLEDQQTMVRNITDPDKGTAAAAAGNILNKAPAGTDVTTHQEAQAAALERIGRGALASQVRGLSPKDFKEQEDSEGDVARVHRSAEEKKKRDNREADELNEQGEAYEVLSKKKLKEEQDALAREERIQLDELRVQKANEDDARKKEDAVAKEAEREEKGKERAAEREKLRRMSPGERRAYQSQKDRQLINGRVSSGGSADGSGAAPDVPTMPSPPAAGSGDNGMTAQQAQEMIGYLKTISGNTEDLGDDATFG